MSWKCVIQKSSRSNKKDPASITQEEGTNPRKLASDLHVWKPYHLHVLSHRHILGGKEMRYRNGPCLCDELGIHYQL